MAFTQNKYATYPFQPQANRVQILPADGQGLKTGYTAGVNGSKIIHVAVASTDTSNRDVTMYITNGGTNYPLATLTIALGSGTTAGVNTADLLDNPPLFGLPIDSDGNPFIYLISGDTLTFNALTTVTTAKAITIHVFAVDF